VTSSSGQPTLFSLTQAAAAAADAGWRACRR